MTILTIIRKMLKGRLLSIQLILVMKTRGQNSRYLDNFLTKPLLFIVFSGDSDQNKLKYHKIYGHLVRKLSIYDQIPLLSKALSYK